MGEGAEGWKVLGTTLGAYPDFSAPSHLLALKPSRAVGAWDWELLEFLCRLLDSLETRTFLSLSLSFLICKIKRLAVGVGCLRLVILDSFPWIRGEGVVATVQGVGKPVPQVRIPRARPLNTPSRLPPSRAGS